MDAQISCRAISTIIRMGEARGTDLSGLTDGLDVDMETLLSWHGFIRWVDAAVVIERLSERFGGIDAYCEMVAAFVDDPAARRLRRFMRVGLTPEQNYVFVFKLVNSLTLPFLISTVKRIDESTILIDQRIPDELPGSLPFLQSAVSFARVLPRVHGLPDAIVDGKVTERSCRLMVTLPPQPSRLRRLKAWMAMAKDSASVIDELVEQQMLALRTNSALQQAVLEGERRTAALAAEIEAKERAEAALAKRNEQLIQARRLDSLGRLAGGVAHDFNNVLTAIFGHTELLRLVHQNDPETQKALDEIVDAGERAAALTRRLLTFAKQGQIQRTTTDVAKQLQAMQTLLRGLLPDVDLKIDLASESLPVHADPLQLEQVIINLAVNARDAMPGGGTVTIRAGTGTRNGNDWVRIEVIDSGVGMSPEVRAKIFEPFFTTKGDLGTGLGLATSYGIVVDAGGQIEVESEPGKGTCFRVWWPRDATTPATGRANEGTESPPMTGHVLVIEDQDAVRRLVVRILTELGFTVSSTADGAGALVIAESVSVDLLVADIMLKEERGPEVVQRIHEIQPGVPVLFVSGYADEATLATLQDSPFLQKPFTAETLGAAVRRVLTSVDEDPHHPALHPA